MEDVQEQKSARGPWPRRYVQEFSWNKVSVMVKGQVRKCKREILTDSHGVANAGM